MPDKKLINAELEKKMEKIREIITEALAQRAEAGIKVRQPLKELRIKDKELKNEKELLELMKEEVNVKEIVLGKETKLEMRITKELAKEGDAREFIRRINNQRKKEGLTPKDKISISSTASEVTSFEEKILNETGAVFLKIKKESEMETNKKREIEIGGKKEYFQIKKINK